MAVSVHPRAHRDRGTSPVTVRTSDAAILSQLITLHFDRPPSLIDTTWGGGRMWRGCAYQPQTRFDVRALPNVDVVGSWDQLPDLFAPGAFQAAVWDPPHQTDGGENALGGGWANAYGTAGVGVQGYLNINHLYPTFLDAVGRVLCPKTGTLLCKIADQAHGGEQHLQGVDFVLACREAGWTVCEMVPKMRRPGPLDPKWRRQLHVRKAWSYWICAHPGKRCPAVGVSLVRECEGCGQPFRARRRDAAACCARCQQRLWRARNVNFMNSPKQLGKLTQTGS
jgi:hypothetical protein